MLCMKKCLFLPVLLWLACFSARAQGISLRQDGIYNNNMLYAKMEKTAANASYSIKTPKGTEVLNARHDDWTHSYIITFAESGQQVAMKDEKDFEQKLARGIVESNMLPGGQYNPRSEAWFISKYAYGSVPAVDKQDLPPVATGKQDYAIVERNHRMPYVGGDSYIKQDGKVIATYKVAEEKNNNKTIRKFTFYLPANTKVAEANLEQTKNAPCIVKTMKDNKEYSIGLKNDSNMLTAREIAIFLSDKGYL